MCVCVCVCERERERERERETLYIQRERVLSLATIPTVKMTILPFYRTNSVSDLTPITTTRQVGKINVV